MGETVIEKIIRNNVGHAVKPGDIVTVNVDRVMILHGNVWCHQADSPEQDDHRSELLCPDSKASEIPFLRISLRQME